MLKIKTGCWLWVILTALLASCPMDGDLESLRQEAIEKNKLTVSFEANGGTPAPASQRVSKGGTITEPRRDFMTKEGFAFGVWYTENFGDGEWDASKKWNFTRDTVTDNMTLYARWIPEGTEFSIVFMADGGTPEPDNLDEVKAGSTITQPTDMTKDGYVFGGWYTELPFAQENKWTFEEDVVTDDMTLYARWIPRGIKFTVGFETNGGTPPPTSQAVEVGGLVTEATGITKEGYFLTGWCIDIGCTKPWNFESDIVTDDITLYAKWDFILPLADISLVSAYLAAQTGGNTPDNPVYLPVQIDLGDMPSPDSGWEELLGTIDVRNKYVNLDLSACTINGTEFNPGTAPAGRYRVVAITIPDTAKSITDGDWEMGTFRYFTNLKSFNSAGLTSIGGDAFSLCTSLAQITLPEGLTSIGDGAFYGCSGLTEITLPEGIGSIGECAFAECTSLTEITLPSTLTSIGDYAFGNCTSLTEITLPSTLTSIGGGAFSGCESLTEITLPSTLTSIGGYAFYGCTSLATITLPSTLTSIGGDAFSLCTSLTQFNVTGGSSSLRTIENGKALILYDELIAYPSASGSVVLPSTLTSIGNGAFYGSTGLTEITLPSTLTSIGGEAFAECTSLTEITLPSTLTSIGDYAFVRCTNLTQFNVTGTGSSLRAIENGKALVLYDELVAYPSAIGSVVLPEGITSIGGGAFSDCTSLTEITLSSTLTFIGGYAFYGCTRLTLVTCLAATPPTASESSFYDIHYDTNASLEIKVPAGSVAAYKAAAGWSEYAGKISAIE